MSKLLKSKWKFVVCSLLTIVIDFASKEWIRQTLSGMNQKTGSLKRISIIEHAFALIYVQNPAGAWSVFRGVPDWIRRPMFLYVTAFSTVLMVYWLMRIKTDRVKASWGLALLIGGSIGNFIDRIRFGAVTDFLDVYIRKNGVEKHWPTFNGADVFILVGLLFLAWDVMRMMPTVVAEESKKESNVER